MTTDYGLLFLLQLTSASFPSGSYAHSSGFETLVASGEIRDASSLWDRALPWLLLNVAPSEGAAVGIAHDADRTDDASLAVALSDTLGALKPSRETYEQSVMTGAAMLRVVSEAFDPESDQAGTVLARDDRIEPHAAMVFGAACAANAVDRDTAIAAYLRTAMANLIEVVGRLVPLGQRDVQRLQADAGPWIQRAAREAATRAVDDLHAMSPRAEISAMNHERITTRLCIS